MYEQNTFSQTEAFDQKQKYIAMQNTLVSSVGGQPRPEMPLETSLAGLRSAIDSLTAALQHLQGKLSAVTHPEGPAAVEKACQDNSAVPILATIDMERNRVMRCLAMTDSMVSRLVL